MKPDRKVTSGGLASSIAVVLVWILSKSGVDIPAEIAAAIAGILSFVVSYLVPHSEGNINVP